MNGWTDKKHKVSGGLTTQSRCCEKVGIFCMTDFSVIKHLLREAKKGSNYVGDLHKCLLLVVSSTLWICINTRTRSMRKNCNSFKCSLSNQSHSKQIANPVCIFITTSNSAVNVLGLTDRKAFRKLLRLERPWMNNKY